MTELYKTAPNTPSEKGWEATVFVWGNDQYYTPYRSEWNGVKDTFSKGDTLDEKELLESGAPIHTVVRTSDNTTWSINDEVEYEIWGKTVVGFIDKFNVYPDGKILLVDVHVPHPEIPSDKVTGITLLLSSLKKPAEQNQVETSAEKPFWEGKDISSKISGSLRTENGTYLVQLKEKDLTKFRIRDIVVVNAPIEGRIIGRVGGDVYEIELIQEPFAEGKILHVVFDNPKK